MKFLNKLSKGFAAVVLTLVAVFLMSGTAHAIPYSGDTTPPAASPAFNVFTGVPSEGNESDFFRGKVTGDTNASINEVKSTCETGKRFTLRVYVHNGASKDLNGNGSGASIAKDSKVKVNLKNTSAKSAFVPDATISSSNAGSVTDDMSITCTDGKVVNLNYVAGTAAQYTRTGSKALSDSIVTTGAAIGTDSPDGNVWGCWEQRVYVTLTVEVKEVPVVVPTSAVCKIEDGAFAIIDNKKRTVSGKIKPELTNATVLEYAINWGDNSAVTKSQSGTHSYAADGKYTIQASIKVRLNDGTIKTLTENCSTVVEFEAGKPPVVVPPTVATPTTLVKTGPASMFSIFAITSILGAVLHRAYAARKASQL